MINQTGRYALHLLGHLVHNPRQWTRAQDLAERTFVPSNYLAKILNMLAHANFVDSRKGWGGGFRIRSEALNRPISEVLQAVEGDTELSQGGCLFGWPECKADDPCPLHNHWSNILETYRDMLAATTVAQLADHRSLPKELSDTGPA